MPDHMLDNATIVGVTFRNPLALPEQEDFQLVNFIVPRPRVTLYEALGMIGERLGNVELRGVQMLGGGVVLDDPEQIPLPEPGQADPEDELPI